LLPALFELPLLLGPLLIQPLARGLPLLFRVLPALLFLRLPLAISPLLFRLTALLIVVVALGLVLSLLLVIVVVVSFATTPPVILSAHEDGRAQAERHNQ